MLPNETTSWNQNSTGRPLLKQQDRYWAMIREPNNQNICHLHIGKRLGRVDYKQIHNENHSARTAPCNIKNTVHAKRLVSPKVPVFLRFVVFVNNERICYLYSYFPPSTRHGLRLLARIFWTAACIDVFYAMFLYKRRRFQRVAMITNYVIVVD